METKRSSLYKESSESDSGSMRYKEWYIETTNRYGETKTWRISDLTLIRQRKTSFFSFNRFTAR